MTIIENLKSELEMSERKRLRLQRAQFLESFESEDLSLWVMIDIMSLILIFFIILYLNAHNATNPTIPRYNEKQIAPLIQKQPVKKYRTNSSSTKIFSTKTNFSETEKQIHKAMTGTDLTNYSIKRSKNKILLVIGEKISFSEGEAQLLDNIKEPLKKIALFLNKENSHRIVISGHTDDIPINTDKFPSNWELSLARAMTVARFMMDVDVDPFKISVEGFGQYKPIADNYYYEGRQSNRRVTISLIKDSFLDS